MIKYVFRPEEPIRIKAAAQANPQVIGVALQEITEEHGGELTPKAVVEKARSKNHPLHVHFEWNDAVAAESFRLEQARNIIRIVRVNDDNSDEGTSRAFISVNDGDSTAYRPFDVIRKSADLQVAILKQAERDLAAFERRYQALQDICQTVKQAREMVQKKINKSESRVAA